jgi:phosphatidylserine decarboxylase
MKVTKEGFPFIIPSLVLCILSLLVGWWILFGLFIILTSAFCFFFRDPIRRPAQNSRALLSPADGKVVKIQKVESCPGFSSPVTVVSIFLSLFDVHITRAPISGVVKELEYKAGKCFKAFKDEASLENEHNLIFLEGEKARILVKQIVGFAARRIKCFVRKNDMVIKGQKIGLMYFGSRVDLHLPQEIRIKVALNQKVKAGITEIAEV